MSAPTVRRAGVVALQVRDGFVEIELTDVADDEPPHPRFLRHAADDVWG